MTVEVEPVDVVVCWTTGSVGVVLVVVVAFGSSVSRTLSVSRYVVIVDVSVDVDALPPTRADRSRSAAGCGALAGSTVGSNICMTPEVRS